MTTSITITFVISLFCLTSGQFLPVREGTTLRTLLGWPTWEALSNTTAKVSEQVESTLENWTDYVAETVNDRLVSQLLTEPFMAGFHDEEVNRRGDTFNDNSSFPDNLGETVALAYDQFIDDANTLRKEALEIVGDVPDWLNLDKLRDVDISKIDFSTENFFPLLSNALDIPEEESRRIAELYINATKLIPVHGYKLGTKAARLANSAKGLLITNLPKLAKNVVQSVSSYPPWILSALQSYSPMLLSTLQSYSPMLLASLQSNAPMIMSTVQSTAPALLSTLQSNAPMLLSSLQSYTPMISSYVASNMGSIMPMLVAML